MSREFIDEANRELTEAYEEPMSLEEYVDHGLEQPQLASHASKYLLEVIEGMVAASADPADREPPLLPSTRTHAATAMSSGTPVSSGSSGPTVVTSGDESRDTPRCE